MYNTHARVGLRLYIDDNVDVMAYFKCYCHIIFIIAAENAHGLVHTHRCTFVVFAVADRARTGYLIRLAVETSAYASANQRESYQKPCLI